MEKYLISGHSGFIGTYLVNSLYDNNKIVGISKITNHNKKILQLKKDILKLDWFKIPKDFSCIIHLAALTNVEICQKNPIECFRINVNGTKNMLEIARKQNSRFIFLSTSHVYGIPDKLPINEKDNTNGSSIYAQSKIGGEILCRYYASTYGLDISIIRLFSVYGPNSPRHLVTTKIISQFNRQKIAIGNIWPKRDFIFIDDAIEAIKIALKKNSGLNTYNVGSGSSHSITEIIQLLKEISGKNPEIISRKEKERKNEIKDIVADISKIKKLGWNPKVDLYQGLTKTYNWNKNKKN